MYMCTYIPKFYTLYNMYNAYYNNTCTCIYMYNASAHYMDVHITCTIGCYIV